MRTKLIILVIVVASILVAALLLAIGRIQLPSLSSISNTSSQPYQQQYVEVEVDFGNENVVFAQVQASTAFEALQKLIAENNTLTLTTQEYESGVFVSAIGSYESTSEMAWIYFVNDQSGTVAADKAQVASGDTVSWRYVEPTGQ